MDDWGLVEMYNRTPLFAPLGTTEEAATAAKESATETPIEVTVPPVDTEKQEKPIVKNPFKVLSGGAKKTASGFKKGKKVANQLTSRSVAVPVNQGTTALIPKVTDLPQPGGIGFLLFIVLFILFAISLAPGHNITRLQLIFKAFMGNASLGDTSNPNVQPSGYGGFTGTDPNNGMSGEYVPGLSGGSYNPYLGGHFGISTGIGPGGY